MKAYWNQLSEREQVLVGLGGIGGLALLFYLLIYDPLVSAVEERKAAWIDKKTTLQWMQRAQQTYAHEQPPIQVTAATLLSVLTELLSHVSFQRFPYQLEQTSSGDIQLTFDAVPYNLFVSWLQTQSKHYTLVIKSLYLSKTNTPGVVKAAVVFTVES